MRSLTIAAFATLLLTTGCHGVDSSAVDTEDIEAHLILTADGDGETEVVAELKPIGDAFGFVDLVSGEALRVHAAGIDRPLESRWFDYHAEVPTDRGGTEFQVRFERLYGNHAPDSWVELPAPFDFYRLPGRYALSWDILPIQWDRIADDPMTLRIEGPCIEDFTRTLSPGRDNGALFLRPGQLRVREHWDGSTCELTITGERVRRGRIDRRFAGGDIVARQVRTMRVWVEY